MEATWHDMIGELKRKGRCKTVNLSSQIQGALSGEGDEEFEEQERSQGVSCATYTEHRVGRGSGSSEKS